MPETKRLIEIYRSRARSSVASKLSALMELERLRSPNAVAFLLRILADQREPALVRLHVVTWLGSGDVPPGTRASVADVLINILREDPSSNLRLQAANALAEFDDVGGVLSILGAIALNHDESTDLRYGAFIALQSAGPGEDCVRLLQRLSLDELLGPSARDLLKLWRA
jgi:HEAT repeat protein